MKPAILATRTAKGDETYETLKQLVAEMGGPLTEIHHGEKGRAVS